MSAPTKFSVEVAAEAYARLGSVHKVAAELGVTGNSVYHKLRKHGHIVQQKGKIIICDGCQKPTVKRGNIQKFCIDCSEAKAEQRKAAWQKAHRPALTPEVQQYRKKHVSKRRERGILRSKNQATKMTDSMPVEGYPDDQLPTWLVRFSVPFISAVSKNYIFGFSGKNGHVYKRQESNEYRNAVALAAKSALRGTKVYRNKIWLDFFVQKPTHKSDAINVVDLLCDALKDGLGVDDRWFCIRRLDWEIVKDDPQIYIGISQGPQFDAQACAYCGSIKAMEEFNIQKHNKHGRHRVCKACNTLKTPIEKMVAA